MGPSAREMAKLFMLVGAVLAGTARARRENIVCVTGGCPRPRSTRVSGEESCRARGRERERERERATESDRDRDRDRERQSSLQLP